MIECKLPIYSPFGDTNAPIDLSKKEFELLMNIHRSIEEQDDQHNLIVNKL